MLHSKTEFDFPMDFHILIPSNTHTSDNISICIETRTTQNLLKHPSAHIYRYADKILHLPISSKRVLNRTENGGNRYVNL